MPICFTLVGCHAEWQSFFAPEFEDIWWQPANMDWCFNFHYSDIDEANELLVYENEKIQNYGPWTFEEPNTYFVDKYKVTVWANQECWDIEIDPFSVLTEDLYACECKIQ